MKSKRFAEGQIIRVLHETEAGLSVADVCRKRNCSERSFYRWKARFGGRDVSEAKQRASCPAQAELFAAGVNLTTFSMASARRLRASEFIGSPNALSKGPSCRAQRRGKGPSPDWKEGRFYSFVSRPFLQ